MSAAELFVMFFADRRRIRGLALQVALLLLNIWRKYSIFWLGLYKPSSRRQNFMRYSRRIRSPAQRILQANFWRKLEALCDWWILCENFPGRWPEERISSGDWTSYLRRCLQAEFVCKLRYFCKRCVLEMSFSLDKATLKSYNS